MIKYTIIAAYWPRPHGNVCHTNDTGLTDSLGGVDRQIQGVVKSLVSQYGWESIGTLVFVVDDHARVLSRDNLKLTYGD